MNLRTPIAVGIVLALCAGSVAEQGVAQAAGGEVCASGETTFGIDVSRYQGDIDWPQLADAGVVFAYIQISRRIDDIDPKFETNWAGAGAVGILRGAYQRFQPHQDVLGQANIFLDKLGPFQAGDLPPMLDVEDSGDLPASVIASRVREWLLYVESATGVRPIIYTGRYFWEGDLDGADFTDYPLWIAHYTEDCPTIPSPWSEWALHQYSSSAVLPGITANTVDVNHFNGSVDDLLALGCANGCEPCKVIGRKGDTVDDGERCFLAGGDPTYMRRESLGFADSLTWTHTTDADEVSNYGRWDLFFAEAGEYLVEASTPAPFNMSTEASYEIEHGGSASAAVLDQSAIDGWSPLGEFYFAEGGDQWIRLGDNTGEENASNTKLVFDALRFTRIDLPPDTGEEPPSVPPDGEEKVAVGGCQVASSSSTGLWVLVLGFLFLRSRRRR